MLTLQFSRSKRPHIAQRFRARTLWPGAAFCRQARSTNICSAIAPRNWNCLLVTEPAGVDNTVAGVDNTVAGVGNTVVGRSEFVL